MPTLSARDIKQRAVELGFTACGIARAQVVDAEARARYSLWLEQGRHGCLEWAERNRDVRDDPRLLLDGARSLVMVAMNYYPAWRQPSESAQVAYYAYGDDYHFVLKKRLWQLTAWIEQTTGDHSRAFVDSAPLRERYWAVQAGLGFIGLNNQLILPGRGSYLVLGCLVTTLELESDEPCRDSCGACRRCLAACPSGALDGCGAADCRRCLSCLTIEYRGERLPEWVAAVKGERVLGCDACQRCCPHNAGAVATTVPEFEPHREFLSLTRADILNLTPAQYRRLTAGSAATRVTLRNLQRNAR